MVHSCKRVHCPHKKRKTLRGGSCGCNKSSTSSSFSGGRSRRTRRSRKIGRRGRKTYRGGSAGLSALSSSAYYPQNSYTNDMSDPSRQIAGRFTDVPRISPSHVGGGKKKHPKKMHGGLSFSDFTNTVANSSGINNTANILFGANVVNPPSYLQSATSYSINNGYSGYNAQNPYLV